MKADIGIHFIIVIFIWLVSWTAAIDIPYEDLNNPNKICGPQSSCEKVDPATAARDAATKTDLDAVDGRRNCLCDPSCGVYGDCCTDSKYFDAVEQQRAAAKYGCARTDGGGGSYVVARCPADWLDPRVRGLCETPGGVERDGMLGNPVTSRRTGLSYRNRFCAVCNSDTTDQIVWNTRLVCEDLTEVAAGSEQAVLETLRYSVDGGDSGHWIVEYLNQPYGCQLAADPPSAVAARPCLPNAVVACHSTWPDDDIRSNCEAYTMVVYNGARPYKNIHCAMCNHVPVQNLTCANTEIHIRFPGQFAPRSFTALFVAEPGHRKCLGSDTFYDPFAKTCRSLVPTGSGVPLNCSTAAMYPVVLPDWRPSENAEYVMLDNGTMAVCVAATADGDVDGLSSPSTEAFKSTTVTYVGLGVSMVFLLVHLSVFAVLPEMKNLSGKNLASFCFSLVCSYVAFVAGNWLTGPACYAGAALTHYLFLTSFAWMLVMSFDCWRTLRLATVELRITTGRQTKKFLVYSAVCWLVPAMMTFVAVAADAVPTVPDSVRPRFGADQCWFGSKTALLVFFAGPLAAIMAVNFVLFIWTAYMIHSSRATVRHINTRHVRRDFRMYCRLAVLMGLTWMTGILASYVDNRYLWILFVVLNTFQGLFVFVAFTCRRRILNALVGRGGGFAGGVSGGGSRGHLGHINRIGHPKDLEKDNNNTNFRASPPSFSWSSSENSSVPVSSEKTSDTLY